MNLYTDGSRKFVGKNYATVIGWAIVEDESVITSGARFSGSNITAELIAILTALEYCNKIDDLKNCNIYTDSKTAMQIIDINAKGYVDDTENYKIAEQINNLMLDIKRKGIAVFINKVEAHCGVRSNEIADRAAKNAVSDLLNSDLLKE